MNKKDNIFTEKEKKALEFLINKRDEAYGLMQFEDGELYQLAEEEFNNYLTIEEIIDKQQKEIEKCKVAFNAQVEALIKMTNVYNNLYNKIREKIKELKDNRSYLSKFDDRKEKEYTNEDNNNMCVEVLEDLLGE